MGQSDDVEDSTYSRHQELCQKLNMDATAASDAWKSYSTIRQNYTLEGDQLHWIGCALYVACRNTSMPTVGRTGSNVEGNCVSLTRLLRLCNLSLIQFFSKCKSWADMANMPQDFRTKIDKIERNFSVSMVIFQKYQPMFIDIFKNPNDDNSRTVRSRRHRPMPCTPSRVFEFCWTLFICVKGAYPGISDDLVNSYHLLIGCCDLVYSNALMANRKDLLNPKFSGLPPNFNDEAFVPPKTPNCIIDLLCDRHSAISFEAKVIKEYTLKKHIHRLFQERILHGDQSNFSGILDASIFDGNHKAINRAYEQHVLSVGDFDERIFLGADASDNIGSPTKMPNVGDFREQFQLKREEFSAIQHLAPPTPLTGRKYLKSKDNGNSSPGLSTATQSVIRLQGLLAGRQASASDTLLEMFNNCSQDVKALIDRKISTMSKTFYSTYTQNPEDGDSASLDFGKQRLILGQTLFYKLLEIILIEEKRMKPNYDITNLLLNEIFLQCLFACCLEIVIWSYKNNDRLFPWILQSLNVEAYYFYKVIEIIVRAEQLPRDVVKHLNNIEEKILESLAWKSDSPLWQAIEQTPGGVPSCADVSLPGTIDPDDSNVSGQPALRRLAIDRGAIQDVQQSPISSASERFQSPPAASGSIKKSLFNDNRSSGQSILKEKCSPKVMSVDGSTRILVAFPDQSNTSRNSSNVTPASSHSPANSSQAGNREGMRPRKTGSPALFFRKFYMLGFVRMQNLCNSLVITETDLKKKIWTIFEYSIKDRTELMKDRHLDQILMCAIYVICKLADIERNTFTEIMRYYRFQPQAESHIYRSVFIGKTPKNSTDPPSQTTDSNANGNGGNNSATVAPPTPSNMAGTEQNFGDERRGDLIKFYNEVYVPVVKEVANRLGLSRCGSVTSLTLSPLPRSQPTINSPVRRVTSSVMTRTLDPKAITASVAPQLTYCFSRSPAKDLEAINRMMISVDARKAVGKRLLSDEMDIDPSNDGGPSPVKKTLNTPFLARKLENLIGERRTQNH
ncbi:retinoblastoma-like protein 1 [Venturia canescens]|uniref:retinoblastoma-like protein 1 n=1 Tax=Venturia canescens TaxID=32260 RepID=UPI001C9C657A|nr:retinoblastoma-like protein 1 [Venturia canescens]XP_043272526.1 retinoblastoma-like protein 1 [Venturia canescens]